MLGEIALILILLIGGVVVFAGSRLAQRAGLSETLGYAASLCVFAIVLGLSPKTWWAQRAGDDGDRLLTYARMVGLTGLMFLAGTGYRPVNIRTRQILSFAGFGVLFFIAGVLVLRFLLNESAGTAALIMATVVSGSLWFASARTTQSYILSLTSVAVLGFYFVDVFEAVPRASRTLSVYAIVTLYELVKLAVVFGFAYFISSRFLTRAEGQISPIRMNVGFILISVLLYALVMFAVGSLGAIAWASFAGALWRQSKAGEDFSRRPKPFASAVLLSLAFLSMPLQSHGRTFTIYPLLLAIVAVAVGIKLIFAWLVLKVDSPRKQTVALLPAIGFSGEMAIVFLSFSITRWFVDAPIFFAILFYAFASSLLIPTLGLMK